MDEIGVISQRWIDMCPENVNRTLCFLDGGLVRRDAARYAAAVKEQHPGVDNK